MPRVVMTNTRRRVSSGGQFSKAISESGLAFFILSIQEVIIGVEEGSEAAASKDKLNARSDVA